MDCGLAPSPTDEQVSTIDALLPTGAAVHLVGIGGAGLSAIATVLHQRGYRVSGSDQSLSSVTESLSALGVAIYRGHHGSQVRGRDLVLASSAIPEDNTELEEARELGIPVLRRPDFLQWLTSTRATVAISGTHGKTTTTAMTSLIMLEAGLDPSYIVGGTVPVLGGSARWGTGSHFVIEADEYKRTFLSLRPEHAVITTIDWDHVDCYACPEDCVEAFRKFSELVSPRGMLVVSAASKAAAEIASRRRSHGAAAETFGFASSADWRAVSLEINSNGGTDFEVWRRDKKTCSVRLQVPGNHNVSNALASIALADVVGIDPREAAEALADFDGVARRFQTLGQVNGITVVDDYAHHPTEVKATLSAARQRFGQRSIWAVFQPHTFSRTKALLSDFARSFGDADHVLVTDIYPAREPDDGSLHARQVAETLDHKDARYSEGLACTAELLVKELAVGDVLITLGAGDSHRIGAWVLQTLGHCDDDSSNPASA